MRHNVDKCLHELNILNYFAKPQLFYNYYLFIFGKKWCRHNKLRAQLLVGDNSPSNGQMRPWMEPCHFILSLSWLNFINWAKYTRTLHTLSRWAHDAVYPCSQPPTQHNQNKYRIVLHFENQFGFLVSFLATMSSSRSDNVTPFVRFFVCHTFFLSFHELSKLNKIS